MMQYFRRNWGETSGNEPESWGTSVWYFEVEKEGFPTRQIQLYENGSRLKYHSGKTFDDYGGLGDQALDLDDFCEFEIEKEEFDLEWRKSNPKKEHQEILDLISDYLASNYSQRFGQALFNLGVNELVDKSDPARQDYRIRDIHGDADAKILERIQQRLAWFEKQRKSR